LTVELDILVNVSIVAVFRANPAKISQATQKAFLARLAQISLPNTILDHVLLPEDHCSETQRLISTV
jgi:hypothetical protein